MTALVAYINRLRGFSPNARLLLARSLIAPLGFGIWGVVFNIYLLTIEVDGEPLFGIDFIFTLIAVDWLVHGLAAFPAGLFSDRFGRRTSFLFASILAVAASLTKLFTLDPTLLLILAGLTGLGSSFHAVTSGPFLIENCRPEDRTHLFSTQTTFGLTAATFGALLGGVLPSALALLGGTDLVTTTHARSALVLATPILLIGLLPIYLIREQWVESEAYARYPWYTAWAHNLTSLKTILKLCSVSAIAALGIGAIVPVFNIYFFDKFQIGEEQVGYIFAISSLAAAAGMVVAPFLVEHLGRVRTIVLTKLLSVPFLLLVALAPTVFLAAVPFMFRAIFNDMGGPIYSLFSMEQVRPEERGTTAGMTHSASEFPMGITGLVMGGVMARSVEWMIPFVVAAVFTTLAYLVFLRHFRGAEAGVTAEAPAAGVARKAASP